ncbi:serine hydrolase domain-containing protein [Desulfatiglans anilini]|uniref:serine hydrolase domain-containing protein n=1 Tax=Desulfatiglans anilini TaxID=90728 RepID=UPI00068546D2|nr:serine hydrolase domain-containing protein [Desulfatiglans anilini]
MDRSEEDERRMPLSRRQLHRGVGEGVFPGAVLLAAREGRILLLEACGRLSSAPAEPAVRVDTLFDLASLTKPLAATMAVMRLVDRGRLHLDQPLETILSDQQVPEDKAGLTPRMLLAHASGLKDWHPFYRDLAGAPAGERRQAVRRAILEMPLVHRPGQATLYSDLGFMLLEWIVERAGGMPLDRCVREGVYEPLGLSDVFFWGGAVPAHCSRTTAATEYCSWRGRMLRGEVHDENAWFMGGFSGHAGLFGTARGVYALTDMLVQHLDGLKEDIFRPATVRCFLHRQDLGDGTRTLGWDTPSGEHSSAGRFFSRQSIGHLGFTGTSVWVDLERRIVVILLTNRVHPSRENIAIRAFRPILHDTVMAELLQET